MAQVGNTENLFGGEFMVQDSDHMSGINSSSNNAQSNNLRGNARQVEQSHSSDSENTSRQQGGERNRKSR